MSTMKGEIPRHGYKFLSLFLYFLVAFVIVAIFENQIRQITSLPGEIPRHAYKFLSLFLYFLVAFVIVAIFENQIRQITSLPGEIPRHAYKFLCLFLYFLVAFVIVAIFENQIRQITSLPGEIPRHAYKFLSLFLYFLVAFVIVAIFENQIRQITSLPGEIPRHAYKFLSLFLYFLVAFVIVAIFENQIRQITSLPDEILRHGYKFLSLFLYFLIAFVIVAIFENQIRQITSLPAPKLYLSRVPEERDSADRIYRNVPTRVLIVAYYRSGSTLAGSIFYDFDEAFYSFEPLYSLYAHTIEKGINLTYFNGSTRKCPVGAGEDRPIAKDILSAIFDCRFQDLYVDAIKRMKCAAITSGSHKFCDCKRWQTPSYILKNCIPDYSKLCLNSTYRVIKTIRVDMDTVEPLLKIYPDLKVIHLLRDPRGHVCSRAVARKCNVTEKYVQQICENGTHDVLKRKLLDEKYPGSFQQVIYENMVANPIQISKEMFTFIGAKLPNYIKVILKNKTHNGKIINRNTKYDQNRGPYGIHSGKSINRNRKYNRNRGPYGTYRQNGLEAAYKWSKYIPWSVMEHVNRHCEKFLELGNFPKIGTEDELLSFKVSQRQRSVKLQ